MATIAFKLLRGFFAGFLFMAISFSTAGLGACICHFIEYGGNAPEKIGWWGTFWIVGCFCIVISVGALVVSFVVTTLSNASTKWLFLFTCIEAVLLGILFVSSIYIFEEIEIKGLYVLGMVFTGFSVVGWMIGSFLEKSCKSCSSGLK